MLAKFYNNRVIKGFIDRLQSTLTYWSFLFFYFLCVFLSGANRLYVRLSLLSHEFEQFGSLHMCALRIYIGRSGTRTRYPWASNGAIIIA